jgi:hypothetical protein
MIKYKRFNREKWDKDVEEWVKIRHLGKFIISPRDRSFIEYWDIECQCLDYELISVSPSDHLLKIGGDYLFPDYIDGSSRWYYSIKDCWEWDKVRMEKFPVEWEWVIRELRIDKLIEDV